MEYRLFDFQLWELEHIFKPLVALRGPWLDLFFVICSYPDIYVEYFIALLVVLLWTLVSWRWGARFFWYAMVVVMVMRILKYLCWMPRPCQLIPELGVLCTAAPGMPSGAAIIAVAFPGFFIYSFPSRWSWTLGVIFGALLSLSRIYLGIHFVSDVLGGWLVGGVLIWSYIRFNKSIEVFVAQLNSMQIMVLGTSIGLIFGVLTTHKPFDVTPSIVGMSMGMALNRLYNCWLVDPQSCLERLQRLFLYLGGFTVVKWLVMVLSVTSFYGAVPYTAKPIGAFFGILWLSCGMNWLSGSSKLLKHESYNPL